MPRAPLSRGFGPGALVSALAAGFGVILLLGTAVLTGYIEASPVFAFGTPRALLPIGAAVFFIIAVYVAGVVTANTVATVIVGRLHDLALRRLIGASGRSLRAGIAAEGGRSALVGAVLGGTVALALSAAGLGIGTATGALAGLNIRFWSFTLVLPILVAAATGWFAAWIGSARVLTVRPIEAVTAVPELPERALGPVRAVSGALLVVVGIAAMVLALATAGYDLSALMVAVLGGLLTFTGIILLSPVMLPGALRLAALVSGRSPVARIASRNGVRFPTRTARSMLGLVIAVTLVSMFIVAGASFQNMVLTSPSMADPMEAAAINATIGTVMMVFGVLFGFSAIIAAVGLVTTLSHGVVQREREFGLLRVLGFTRAQIRRMVLIEAVQMGVVSVAIGLLCGTGFGWVGAQSLLGPITEGFVAPTIPLALILTTVVLAIALAAAASVLPARRAVAVSPVGVLQAADR